MARPPPGTDGDDEIRGGGSVDKLEDTLGQALDTTAQQGGAPASQGADDKTELGGEQLAGLTEVDEAEDLNPNDVIKS